MKKLTFTLITLLLIITTSCTKQTIAKEFGGTLKIELEQGQRLINCTWKEANLWVLTKQDTTKPTTYTFKEDAEFGILNGEIIIIEK